MARRGAPDHQVKIAENWLEKILSDGPKLARDIRTFSPVGWRTMLKVKKRLRVVSWLNASGKASANAWWYIPRLSAVENGIPAIKRDYLNRLAAESDQDWLDNTSRRIARAVLQAYYDEEGIRECPVPPFTLQLVKDALVTLKASSGGIMSTSWIFKIQPEKMATYLWEVLTATCCRELGLKTGYRAEQVNNRIRPVLVWVNPTFQFSEYLPETEEECRAYIEKIWPRRAIREEVLEPVLDPVLEPVSSRESVAA